jgi:DNA-3-methyladenine glycosylase
MRARRPTARRDQDLANGPGKLTLALGINRTLNGADVTRGPLTVHPPDQETPFEIGVSPRIGIKHCVDWPLRFFVKGSPFVSR